MPHSHEDPIAYRDAFGSVARVHPVVDAWSAKNAHFADWANDMLDEHGTCRVEASFSDDSVKARASRAKAALAVLAGVVAKGSGKPVQHAPSAKETWLEMRLSPMWGFMVNPARDRYPNRWIPEGEFEEICRLEVIELRRMGLTRKASESALSAMKARLERHR